MPPTTPHHPSSAELRAKHEKWSADRAAILADLAKIREAVAQDAAADYVSGNAAADDRRLLDAEHKARTSDLIGAKLETMIFEAEQREKSERAKGWRAEFTAASARLDARARLGFSVKAIGDRLLAAARAERAEIHRLFSNLEGCGNAHDLPRPSSDIHVVDHPANRIDEVAAALSTILPKD